MQTNNISTITTEEELQKTLSELRMNSRTNYDMQGVHIPLSPEISFTPANKPPVRFKYSEQKILQEAIEHAMSTYQSHYASNIEPLEFIFEKDLNVDFLINSALTYLARYGKKKGHNERDLFKAIHFLVIAIHYTRDLKHRGLINETK